MFYVYTAICSQGRRVKGVVYASHRQNLREILFKSEKLELLSARRAWGIFLLQFFQKSPWDWLQNFFFQMSCLLRAGIPVPEALKSLKEMESSRYRRWVIGEVLQKIQRGNRLSDVLENRKRDFPNLVSPMIRVGEASGDLGKAFEDLSAYALWRQKNQQNLQQKLRYPLFVLCLVVCLIAFLMTSVVPSLLGFLETSGEGEQAQTLIFATDLFSFWAPWLLMGGAGMAFGVFIGIKVSPKIRGHFHTLLWRAPFYSSLMIPIIRTRFFHALSLLVGGGVTLLEALPLAAKATQKPFFEARVNQIIQKMHSGVSLEDALVQEDILLNSLYRHLLCVAEKSGEMPNVLKEICRLSQEEMTRKINVLTGALEPSLLLFLGGIMGWIAWSIFQPIYDQLGSMGGAL